MENSESNYELVSVHKAVAMQTPKHVYFDECGITAYSCPIPQTPDIAKIVHFVSGSDGDEFGQYPTRSRAMTVAASIVHGVRQATAARAVQILKDRGYSAEASEDGKSVMVDDPVTCRRGARCWVEYATRKVYVDQGFSALFSFIQERS